MFFFTFGRDAGPAADTRGSQWDPQRILVGPTTSCFGWTAHAVVRYVWIEGNRNIMHLKYPSHRRISVLCRRVVGGSPHRSVASWHCDPWLEVTHVNGTKSIRHEISSTAVPPRDRFPLSSRVASNDCSISKYDKSNNGTRITRLWSCWPEVRWTAAMIRSIWLGSISRIKSLMWSERKLECSLDD